MCALVGWDGHSLSHPLGVNFTLFLRFSKIFLLNITTVLLLLLLISGYSDIIIIVIFVFGVY